MRQRAMIAMALVHNPDVLIADEPTTALDVTVQAQILELIDRVKHDFDIGVILITHDLGVLTEVAQTVMVMYAGRAMEIGPTADVLVRPLHPYAWGLLESLPVLEHRHERLTPIEGSPPSLILVPPGCPFHPRCPYRFEPCDSERPELVDRGGGHPDACHLTIERKRQTWATRERLRLAPPA
jgi:peptide/nickel transport system ATP-binding protein